MKKVALHSLGCKVNSYETESMEELFRKAGYEIVPFKEDVLADVYVINTCSVTNIADRKSRQMLHKAKKMNPESVVIACGCYVESDSAGVIADECVDIVIGNNRKFSVVEALEEYYKDSTCNVFMNDINKDSNYENLTIETVSEHTRAYIKIQDGCNQFCSYCIIPYVRGRIRSRQISDIVEEVKGLAAKGFKEVVLTGIHITSYGLDFVKESDKGLASDDYLANENATAHIGLLDVIKAINEIDGIERIRLSSLEPRVITEEFAKEIAKMPKLCPHFHLSLQSGNDKTLKAMNRKYDTKEFMEGVNRLRKYLDKPALTTDIIVGFPGETDEDFNETYEYLKKVNFYEMHIFKYSRRKGTVADKMPAQVNGKDKNKRSNSLLLMTKVNSLAYRKDFLENTKFADVLIEELVTIDDKEYYTGYTKNYIRVAIEKEAFKGYSIVSEDKIVNTIVKIKAESLMSDNETVLCSIIGE
ncbi:tRNA (N(6)-L-threonylcarbamoyladenosine(37)-C(2))-methylthiotransferase MtaB [Lachnospira multipara]|uniref:Threonylcarbamoyladenosine tRNA methylthiotransferase MtaB n=1 Tax=Lachnospira multipara TaxID=28051 RepID=A0A1H5RRA9_9FIRM|nr:tRNA (N(6)-L-threonylcarbamoyladenosine(37)-C(2))-methylthiotransferase MtaB [Lachnospira multipara]SEF40859.1 threonylcarbamoyladenosine tRNA methylthiotransferase MtaB [Lachnospira multipara]